MLDIYLAGFLFGAIEYGKRIVLIGDADQLSSVGPGAVLSEIIASGRIPVVRLDKVFRQDSGSRIATNAKKIRHGDASLEYGDDFQFIPSPNMQVSAEKTGFGLQFSMAGEDFEENAPNELGMAENGAENQAPQSSRPNQTQPPQFKEEEYTAMPTPPKELTQEEKLQQAMAKPCPITKFSGKTLGEVLPLDPGAVTWVATKFKGDEEIIAAARFICEYAAQQATA